MGKPFLTNGFPHTPFHKLSHKNYLNRVVSAQTDGRREDEPRFCSRERLGTSKTLSAKKVVWNKAGCRGRHPLHGWLFMHENSFVSRVVEDVDPYESCF